MGVMDRLVLRDDAWERMEPLIIGRPDQKGSIARRVDAEAGIGVVRGVPSARTVWCLRRDRWQPALPGSPALAFAGERVVQPVQDQGEGAGGGRIRAL